MDLWRIELVRDRALGWEARVFRAELWIHTAAARGRHQAFMDARRWLESHLRQVAAELLNSWRRSGRSGHPYLNGCRFAELPDRLRARVFRRIAARMAPEEFRRWRSYFDGVHHMHAQWGYFTNDYRESVSLPA